MCQQFWRSPFAFSIYLLFNTLTQQFANEIDKIKIEGQRDKGQKEEGEEEQKKNQLSNTEQISEWSSYYHRLWLNVICFLVHDTISWVWCELNKWIKCLRRSEKRRQSRLYLLKWDLSITWPDRVEHCISRFH